ncbi:hypothetical protein ACWDX6_05965 [Streptomyces sp. NPDC003027]
MKTARPGGTRARPYRDDTGRSYVSSHTPDDPAGLVDLLRENLADYRALVHRTDTDGLPALLPRLLAERGAGTVLVPSGLPAE